MANSRLTLDHTPCGGGGGAGGRGTQAVRSESTSSVGRCSRVYAGTCAHPLVMWLSQRHHANDSSEYKKPQARLTTLSCCRTGATFPQ